MYLAIQLPPRTDRWTVTRISPRLRQILLDRVRQVLHAHRLQPDASRPRERGKEEAAAAEERVLDPGHGRDVELHRFLVHADVARVYAQGVARLQVVGHDLAVQLDPRLALPLEALHPESRAAENARAQPLLEADGKLDADGGAHETVPVNHEALARGDIHGQDLAWQLGRECEQPGPAHAGVLGHEEGAAGDRSSERTHEATLLPTGRRRRLQLHRHRHPGHLARLGENFLVGLHAQLEHGHDGSDDLWLHVAS